MRAWDALYSSAIVEGLFVCPRCMFSSDVACFDMGWMATTH